jgi:hypothetical protein
MKFIRLTMVAGTRDVRSLDNYGEDDGVAQIGEREVTKPLSLNVEDISAFYPRREPRVGTRIKTKEGAAYPVTETYDVVNDMIASINN